MKITLKTSRPLAKYLPPGSSGNTANLQVAEGATPIDIIERLGLPAETNYLITLNGAIVPLSQRATCSLSESDQLSIMPPLKGG